MTRAFTSEETTSASQASSRGVARAAAGEPALWSSAGVQRLHGLVGNKAVSRVLGSAGPPTVQRFAVSDMKQSLGREMLKKHIGLPVMPDLSTQEQQENALEAVYYHRPFERGPGGKVKLNDRKDMNSVFFADPGAIFEDLRSHYEGDNLDNAHEYSTTGTYPVISVVRIFDKDANAYRRAQLQYGSAKPVVKINKDEGVQAFNHLQKTDPPTLDGVVLLRPR